MICARAALLLSTFGACTGVEVGNPPARPSGPVNEMTGIDTANVRVLPNLGTGLTHFRLELPTDVSIRLGSLLPLDAANESRQALVPVDQRLVFPLNAGTVRVQLTQADGQLTPLDLEVLDLSFRVLTPSPLMECLNLPTYGEFAPTEFPFALEIDNECAADVLVERTELRFADAGYSVSVPEPLWETGSRHVLSIDRTATSESTDVLLLQLEHGAVQHTVAITLTTR